MNAFLLQTALSYYGLHEAPGTANNPVIMQMAKDCGFTEYVGDSEAWCSLFANFCAMKCGYKRSKSLAARSWLNDGIAIEVDNIEDADLVVFWRDSPTSGLGHVGFPIREVKTAIYTLGGNQGDEVCIEPIDIARKLKYLKLIPLDSPATIMS